jgi:hypothetical protein
VTQPESPFAPPFTCVICESDGPFTAVEHIVPDSMAYDIVAVDPGWVCDRCNNRMSKIERRALSDSFLGVARCTLGVVTKRGRPAKAFLTDAIYEAMPGGPRNSVWITTDWSKRPGPVNKFSHQLDGPAAGDAGAVLLKIGYLMARVCRLQSHLPISIDLSQAQSALRRTGCRRWPYAVTGDHQLAASLESSFPLDGERREAMNTLGFDHFFWPTESYLVSVVTYGGFLAGTCLTSPDLRWTSMLRRLGSSYIACPGEFKKESWGPPQTFAGESRGGPTRS